MDIGSIDRQPQELTFPTVAEAEMQ